MNKLVWVQRGPNGPRPPARRSRATLQPRSGDPAYLRLMLLVLLVIPVAALAQEHAAEEPGMFSGLLWPTVNFAILVGGLWWFLKQPIATYLTDRHEAIRKDLVEAANVKAAAAAQLSEIDRKLQSLPGELDALRRRGAEEIAAEEQRIAAVAAAERDRLLEQTRREIELQVRLAKRALVEHAADLSVQLATERIQKTITPADQERLVDRYVDGLGTKKNDERRTTNDGRRTTNDQR